MTDCFNPNFYTDAIDDSAMIQAAVDAAAEFGEKVIIPRHNERTGRNVWNISKAIRLHSKSVICLDNCVLRQADGVYDNIFVNSNLGTPKGFTREGRQYDICIYGVGNAVLDGGEPNGLTERTQFDEGMPNVTSNCMINFLNTERISIKNLRIVNQRYWSMVFHYCSHGRISDIDFYALHTVHNQDGIDLRTGCSHFTIENITGCTGDDTVALTCLKSHYDEDIAQAGFDDSIHHVIIRNICSTTPCALVRLLNHGGKLLYNVIIENIMNSSHNDTSQERGINLVPLDEKREAFRPGACVRIGENFYFGEDFGGSRCALPEETYNITVRNVIGRSRTGIRASCALSNALFENIQLYGEGGTAVYFGEGTMKNIRISDIGYPLAHKPCAADDNRRENHYNQQKNPQVLPDRKLCAVYFKQTDAQNILVRNLYASDKLTAVFGGDGCVSMKGENIVRESKLTPLIEASLNVRKMSAADTI